MTNLYKMKLQIKFNFPDKIFIMKIPANWEKSKFLISDGYLQKSDDTNFSEEDICDYYIQ